VILKGNTKNVDIQQRYGDSVDNTVEENSSVFSLIQMHWLPSARVRPFNGLWSGTTRVGRYQKKRQQGYGYKTLHQQNYTVTAPHSGVRHSEGPPFRGSTIPEVRHSEGPPFLSLTLQEARVQSYSAHCATLVYLTVSLKCDVTFPVLHSDRHSLTIYESDNIHKLQTDCSPQPTLF